MSDYTVLAPDKKRARKFLYHATEKPIIIYIEDAKDWYPKGWQNTPAAFFDMKKHGVPADKMPELHKEIEEIKDLTNDDLNLEAMSAKQLKAFAKKYLPGLEYGKNANKKQMLDLIVKARAAAEKETEEFLEDDLEASDTEETETSENAGDDDNSTEDN